MRMIYYWSLIREQADRQSKKKDKLHIFIQIKLKAPCLGGKSRRGEVQGTAHPTCVLTAVEKASFTLG